MATSSASTSSASTPHKSDNPTSAQTSCSTCRTVFEVSSELLKSTDTRVRCGECYAIFDAASNLVEGAPVTRSVDVTPSPAVPPASSGDSYDGDSSVDNADGLDVTYSDFDLFSEDADLPEIAYFDQTRDTPEFDFDTVALEEDETFNDTLFAHDVTVDAGSIRGAGGIRVPRTAVIGKDAPRVPLEFHYQDPEPDAETPEQDSPEGLRTGAGRVDTAAALKSASPEAESTDPAAVAPAESATDPMPDPLIDASDSEVSPSADARRGKRGSIWLMLVLLLALSVLVCALYAWRHRDSIHNNTLARPAYEMYCRVTGCAVPSRVSLGELKLTRRNVYSHPDIEDALVIDVSFRNQAEFAQRYPTLLVRLSDPSGRMVARRGFRPGEYMPGWQQQDTIAAGVQIDISLDVTDPGDNASSFEVDFATTPWDTP